MNISKNILSLGLIAVISGISTAQTYTATAGTNGITDIQSDYSMSTGDGASVSVDVPLEFELPKKVAIAVAPEGTKTLPANEMFNGIIPYFNTQASKTIDITPHSATWDNLSTNYIGISGGIYCNAEASVTVDYTDFIHETDSNSIIKPRKGFELGAKAPTGGDRNLFGVAYDDNDSSTTMFPKTFTLDTANLITQNNQASFWLGTHMYLDTIDTTDRAGKYFGTVTITANIL